ncbi:phosphopentomutase [Flocculibacter collagenilyticus]|uniref:phosphopentomutase n=1 Tax=Flocculibacter collagenilyticus TaxID=2744479 RepID=UPI0018F4F596|nr:phosphopentomutase [Flocculibacter collagenilyticus]
MARAFILVTDGFGIGHAPDAEQFGDVGANTFLHLKEKFEQAEQRELDIPVLTKLGLMKAASGAANQTVTNQYADQPVIGAWGYAAEISSGKDTPSGHWEMMGVPVLYDWGYFHEKQNSFPQEFIDAFCEKAGVDGILGNCHASGTDIIKRLGEEHNATGKPICYTSADSVFQIACNESHFGLERLYEICEIAYELLKPYNIGRVIARPFIGETALEFERTGNRRDYSVLPPEPTLLDKAAENGQEVVSIGKIADIYAHQGITQKFKATGLEALMDTAQQQITDAPDKSIVFTNLVDFDQNFGHRRDPVGFARALEYFDGRLGHFIDAMHEDDLLFIISDHGCDPTWPGTEHTREFVPMLAYGKKITAAELGHRKTFADLGQTLAELFTLSPMNHGESFLKLINTSNH